MRRRPLVWRLFPIYFVITAVSVVLVGLYAHDALREFYYSQAEQNLLARAALIRQLVAPEGMVSRDFHKIVMNARGFTSRYHTRITLISPSGLVLEDSESDPATMENHADRPEVQEAMSGKHGVLRRRSPTLGITMVYAAVPIHRDGELVGVVRVAEAATAVDARPEDVYHHLAAAVALVALMAAAASLAAARRISKPVRRLKEAAERLAQGDFSARAAIPITEEFASLATTLNSMAAQLDRQVRTITQQASDLQAILTSMNEGVVAVGRDGSVMMLNPAAEVLLGVTLEQARGKSMQEVVRNPSMQRFYKSAYESGAAQSEEIALRSGDERIVQMTAMPLLDTDQAKMGVLIVLDDVTQTRKLETVRKDFVANVSHELRTPITSIKGFVETLREAMVEDPEKARHFLNIVERQADRLNAITEDLLALATIEQRSDTGELPREDSSILEVLNAAVTDCQAQADSAQVAINVQCKEDLIATVNAPLLEQAVTNLLDNAVKYSPAGSSVTVTGDVSDDELFISVADSGPGIEAEFIPRLFERFYRVDKARSRKLGGTGLGLAIVKHIVQAHRGRVDVESAPGKGCTFRIRLPLRKNSLSSTT